MIPILGDTNVILRWSQPNDASFEVARSAVETLHSQGSHILITPQVLIELWALATRPIEANGLGLDIAETFAIVEQIRQFFPLLPDTDAIFPRWLELVQNYHVIGRQVYDARLVAVMQVHEIPRILTFNGTHFRRFPIDVIDPTQVS